MDGVKAGGSDDEAATAMDVGAEAASGEELSEDDEDEVSFGAAVKRLSIWSSHCSRCYRIYAVVKA